MDIERSLARVVYIDDILPHNNADSLELAKVGGWQVVVRKGEFVPGDQAVYFEIDSWIPTKIAPFLSKDKEPKEYNGVKGERLRTVRLRGELSQGLLIPVKDILPDPEFYDAEEDVTQELGILKWEKPVPANLAGQVRGNFPSRIPKTDQERVQNIKREIERWAIDKVCWEVTEKLDGSSCTIYRMKEGEEWVFGVCSRNLDLKETDDNLFWRTVNQYAFREILESLGGQYAIQAELIGPGVQGNPYKLDKNELRVFDVFNIGEQRYLTPKERHALQPTWEAMGIQFAPLIVSDMILPIEKTVETLLTNADGQSLMHPFGKILREGLVFKCYTDGSRSFKVISNEWLLKTGN